jgi:hypothetical protein
MIGTVWRRRYPADDEFDEIIVRGWFGGQDEADFREVVVV